ncbi:MAG: polysaccharide deacetylase family protein [Rhodanobacteraceae bacterium]|nr:polysaccharide deacetylase family protein [Rhodanobacteraceae bacterium]
MKNPNPPLILCYHSTNVSGHDYALNDHVALRADLAALHAAGFDLVHASDLDTAPQAGRPRAAITFDDGMVLDALDFEHPSWGHQDSFLRILRDHHEQTGQHCQAASFVIASPQARAELDRKDFLSLNVWHDDWWQEANDSGYMTIENHSWDHNHPSLDRSVQRNNERGSFLSIETLDEAMAEVAQACDYIEQRCGRRPSLFAYPWGQANDYLVEEFFPQRGADLGLTAAFVTTPRADRPINRWSIPRWVCGTDWRSPEDFAALLRRHCETTNPA